MNTKKGKDNKCFIDRTGEKYPTYQKYVIEIIDCMGSQNNTVQFNDEKGTILYKIAFKEISSGSIKNPHHPSVCGIGYSGIGKYRSSFNSKNTKCYEVWRDMIRRCYDLVKKKTLPTYKTTVVCEEWHNFQNFGAWFENNWKPHMDGWDLDKDLKIKGNKVYSPETCLFVPHRINSLIINCHKVRGDCPIGVNRVGNRFISRGVGENKDKRFGTVVGAFEHYKLHKEIQIKQIADEWRPLIGEEVYEAMYRWQVEITD